MLLSGEVICFRVVYYVAIVTETEWKLIVQISYRVLSQNTGWATKVKMCIYQYITMEVYSFMSFIYPSNKYLWSVYLACWGYSGKDRNDLCLAGTFRPLWVRHWMSNLWVLQKGKPGILCHLISHMFFWKFLKDAFSLISKSHLDSDKFPVIEAGGKINLQAQQMQVSWVTRVYGGCFLLWQLSFHWIKHTWTRCYLYAFSCAYFKIISHDETIRSPCLRNTAIQSGWGWHQIEITHKIYISS